jgi:chromosomal replication initiation ATPase DnaA
MQSTITDEISAINEAIAEKIGPQKFRIWFKNSTRLTLTDAYLKVGVPNLFIAGWIENHFSNEINEAVRAVPETAERLPLPSLRSFPATRGELNWIRRHKWWRKPAIERTDREPR